MDLAQLIARAVAVGATVSPTSQGWIVSSPWVYGMECFRWISTPEQLIEVVLVLEQESLARVAKLSNGGA
jgi:hypothetical protein